MQINRKRLRKSRCNLALDILAMLHRRADKIADSENSNFMQGKDSAAGERLLFVV